jgi:hypothetical protein
MVSASPSIGPKKEERLLTVSKLQFVSEALVFFAPLRLCAKTFGDPSPGVLIRVYPRNQRRFYR